MKWNNVKDSLPETEKDVLCILQKFGERYPFYRVMSYEYDTDNKLYWWDEFGNKQDADQDYFEVTHWTELPDINKIIKK